MIIREATPNDLPSIVSVVRSSMGEESLPVSEEIWRYKHWDNPFGKSPVFVAEQSGKIVGVRALMEWKWQRRLRTYRTLRAVDTATHPDYQGKGIFKKLTLAAVNTVSESGFDFIFNTPNDNSRPGYLKMGWEPVSKIKVGIKPVLSPSFFKINLQKEQFQTKVSEHKLNILCDNWNSFLADRDMLFTPKSFSFLKWRYEANPLLDYDVRCTENFYIAAYLKTRGRLRELRISEMIVLDETIIPALKAAIKDLASGSSAHFISFAPDISNPFRFSLKGKIGPILTIRKLHNKKDMEVIKEISRWGYSLGDLELF